MLKKRRAIYSGATLCLIAVVIALIVFWNPAVSAQNVPAKEPTLKGSEVAAYPNGTYSLHINGVMVTSANMGDIFGDQTASYDAKTNTLTLNGVTITEPSGYSYASGICWSQDDRNNPFTIHLADGSDNWIIMD